MAGKIVCSTTHLFHYMFNPNMDEVNSFVENGVRPLSDFPDSERWQQLEKHMPGFYRNLYMQIAQPVLMRSYSNSGIFVTPIDFRLLPGTYLHEKPRFVIPNERIDADWAVATYVINDERMTFPFDREILEQIATTWDDDMVLEWFGRDQTKVFYYVPQVAVYQGRIDVDLEDYDA